MKIQEILYMTIIAVLGFLQFQQCQKQKIQPTILSVCDTVFLKPDTVVEMIEVPLPYPVIDTIYEVVETIITLKEPDSFYVTLDPILDTVYLEGASFLYIYDSTFEHANYTFDWHIESLGKVRALSHRITPKFHLQQVNNITNPIDKRKWIVAAEAAARTDFNSLQDASYYIGGGIYRNENKVLYGASYLREVYDKNDHIVKATIGLKF